MNLNEPFNNKLMTHTLLFACSPEGFHPGLNVTVRAGDKWRKVHPGDSLEIRKTDTNELMQVGHVVFTASATWESLPEYWLRFEHAVSARTKEGLAKAMDSAYGPATNWREDLTVLFFWL